MNIRPCKADDLSTIHAIQLKCPQAAQWRQEDYAQLSNDALGLVLVVEIENQNGLPLAGFAAFHRALDEAELRNMAVDPAHHRKGIARALLEAGIHALEAYQVARLFLEVRASNQPAIALYRSADFRLVHRRRDYYHDPAEDALAMACDLAPSSDSSPASR